MTHTTPFCPVWAFGNRLWVRDSKVFAPYVTESISRLGYRWVEMTFPGPWVDHGSGAPPGDDAPGDDSETAALAGPLTGKEQRGFRIRSQPDHHWRPSESGS
ncbi:hypothetical protein GCM10010309_20930 [Streptomyces violaceochromogenes]|nr:hypothetical protein GCM10010309_20930 [Streptomyces violaceochromogenes]